MSEWISVNVDLPEPFLKVLVTDGKLTALAVWVETKWGNGWKKVQPVSESFEDITHWSHIPEPPKETK